VSEPLLPRAQVCQQADEAAREAVRTQSMPACPYPIGSDAAAAWKVCLERYLLLHSSPESEASA
jgi:hypothetical protein